MKNWIVLHESRREWFGDVTMYENQMQRVNGTKKVQWEGIERYAFFYGRYF